MHPESIIMVQNTKFKLNSRFFNLQEKFHRPTDKRVSAEIPNP